MLFSIITVVRNDRDGFQVTMESVERQTFTEFEWIVVDGASTDGTVDLIRSAERVSHWISEDDSGTYHAMNKGIAAAKGEYLVFLNAGDAFTNEDVLQLTSNLISSGNEPDIVFGGAYLMFPRGKHKYRGPRDFQRYVRHGLPAIHQATYYRRQTIEPNSYDLKYRICGDYYLVAMLSQKGVTAEYIDVPLVNFQVGGMSTQSPARLLRECYVIQRDVLGIPIGLRVVSFTRRLINMLAVIILYRAPVTWAFDKSSPRTGRLPRA